MRANSNPRTIDSLKSTILSPALTTHFAVLIKPPREVEAFLRNENRFETFDAGGTKLNEIMLLCSDATLPGSTLFTHEVTNDYPGVTEKMAYRRQYDDYSSFGFYVDQNYEIIEFFESWINFIVNENDRDNYSQSNVSYRINFRDDYAGEMAITKFERDAGAIINTQQQNATATTTPRKILNYKFIKAFPISIDSMPVSYEGATILKCNVNFTYLRYVRERLTK